MGCISQLVRQARTCRRFQGSKPVSLELLRELVDVARMCPSARNLQLWRFGIVHGKKACEKLLPSLTLGGRLKPEERATEKQHPTGYVIIYMPKQASEFSLMDVGIAAQSMNLAATEMGLAMCMVGAFNKPAVMRDFPVEQALGAEYEAKLILTLGYPDEVRHAVPFPVEQDGTLRTDPPYVHAPDGTHVVYKYGLEHIVVFEE